MQTELCRLCDHLTKRGSPCKNKMTHTGTRACGVHYKLFNKQAHEVLHGVKK